MAEPLDIKSPSFIVALLAVAVIMCIICWVANAAAKSNWQDGQLEGLWAQTDPQLCRESGIQSLLCYIGPSDGKMLRRNRTCCLLITPQIYSGTFELSYRAASLSFDMSHWNKTAELTKADDDFPWPDTATLEYDVPAARLNIFDEDGVCLASMTRQ